VLEAIAEAQWLTFGPGSWFSSVMPHFLLADLSKAISESPAKKIIIFNLPDPEGADEFAGSTPEEHLELVLAHSPDFRFDIAIADPAILSQENRLESLVNKCGGKLVLAEVSKNSDKNHHDPVKMSSLFSHIFGTTLLR
jgi:2-phospho-L-lactate transferase/gluconeogenesis factor (CofD/UPF0052 family)